MAKPTSISQLIADPSCMDDYDPNAMSVNQARKFIQQFLQPLAETEILPLRETLWRVLAAARASGLAVVLDFKRGDIGISAEHYAASARSSGAHWTTISAYLGADGILPFLAQGHGAFART